MPTSSPTTSGLNVLTRDDLLILLASIGVILPAHTKIPTEDLTKKLTAALEAAQELHEVLTTPTLHFSAKECPLWPANEDVARAAAKIPMRTFTLAERRLRESRPPNFISTDKKDTFQELRQIPLSFANHWKAGHRHFCLLDDARQYGVYVRLVEVHKLSDKPLFILLYKELFSTPSKSFVDLFPILVNQPTGQFGMMSISTTDMERVAMVKIFKQNAKRLPPGYMPRAFTRAEARRTGLKASFALPIVPPDMRVLGKLSDNAGCEVCGNKKINRCSECMTVAYCSPACQKADWKTHKPTCKSLSGGTWSNVHIDEQPPYFVTFEHVEKLKRRWDAGIPGEAAMFDLPATFIPEDIHQRNLRFMVKIQPTHSDASENRTMLIYDKHRTFNVLWFRMSDARLFDQVETLPDESGKIYRWARRVGDRDLEVCFDRPPALTPVW